MSGPQAVRAKSGLGCGPAKSGLTVLWGSRSVPRLGTCRKAPLNKPCCGRRYRPSAAVAQKPADVVSGRVQSKVHMFGGFGLGCLGLGLSLWRQMIRCTGETQKTCTITCTLKRQVEPTTDAPATNIQIIRSSMEAQGATVRWVDHDGMYADAMTKRNGNVPLLQILIRTSRICITEEAPILEGHQLQPSSRSSSSKTRVDPAAQSDDTQSKSQTRWSGNTRKVNEAQKKKKMLGSCQRV